MRYVCFTALMFVFTNGFSQFTGGCRDGYQSSAISGIRIDGIVISNATLFQGGIASGHNKRLLSGSLTNSGLLNIYTGGVKDGNTSDRINSIIDGRVLDIVYTSANGDGFSSSSIPTTLTRVFNAFNGSIGDGHSADLHSTLLTPSSSLAIYNGGDQDGHSLTLITTSIANDELFNIYNGGNLDGSSITLAGSITLSGEQLNLFAGGIGDGNSEATLDGFFIQALPVEIISFEALQRDQAVILLWSTASEINNDRFEIERSVDGVSFYNINTVDGAGASFKIQHYEAVDEKPVIGFNYYLLKQVDFDGQFSYSEVRSTNFIAKSQPKLSIYPNPNKTRQLHFVFNSFGSEEIAELTIYNQQGKILTLQTINVGKVFEIPWSWPAGLYEVQVVRKNIRLTKKLLIVD